jgi:predicted RNA-binding Zn-ribbon protein involved in translation (DUF1610 family)
MDKYQPQWRAYRRLVVYWVALFATFVPFVGVVSALMEKLFRADVVPVCVAGFWVCLWVGSFIRICAFACPRCGKCFIGRWWYGNFFLFRQCAHYGLQRDPNALAVFPSRR